ncbi:hypothetical protein KI387_008110 [Taxus chinensis]|uniref:Uncharacterized protein n=1 Tax=Taxus chinensis TaxID=29808 RepID=A0AA38CPV3_TAXCH|nr:hypothetical protein KI387_008110 [Taxus chinensis]
MFGVSNKDAAVAINTGNIFAALESKKKKGSSKKKDNTKEAKKATEFWTKAPVSVKSWADCEDDDDDYYATALPPAWGKNQPQEKEESDKEESDDQEDYDIDNDADEETDEKEEVVVETSSITSVLPSVLQPNKITEPEKQLSKKEIKKKELAELDKVLEEFGILTKENVSDASQGKRIEEEAKDKHDQKPSEPALSESRTARKRKTKKDKSKEEEVGTIVNGYGQEKVVERNMEANAVVADPKSVLKRLVSQQKKKSVKESAAAAKGAAAEAAARAAKQSASKKKDKMHYNQHPPK